MTRKNWLKYVSELDELVRSGRGSEVRRRLMSERRRKMPGDVRIQVANIARRSGLPLLSLQILRPLVNKERVSVRTPEKTPTLAVNQEQQAAWASYGAGLIAIGALDEGRAFLDRVNADEYPEILLTSSIGFFKEWDYGPSVPLLKRFIASANITDYQRLVGQVNLAAAYSALGRYQIAQRMIRRGLRQAKQMNAKLLLGNLFEILAQNYFFQGDYERAQKTIENAQATLQSSNVLSNIFVKKWKTFLEFERVSGTTEKCGEQCTEKCGAQCNARKDQRELALVAAAQLRAQAIASRHWETVRDLDFHFGIWQKDVNTLEKLYWGTPFLGYRQKIVERAHQDSLPLSIEKNYFEVGEASNDILDLQSWTWRGQPLNKTERMKNNHRMLLALFRDLYRSERVGRIYSLVFPGEYFDAFSSVNRLNKCTQRLRNWLELHGIPLNVDVRASEFRIEMKKPICVRLPTDVKLIENDYTYFLQLYRTIKSPLSDHSSASLGVKLRELEKLISNEKARSCWGVSRRTAQRLLARLEARGWLTSIGNGRGRVYTFTKQILPSGWLRSQRPSATFIDLSKRRARLKTG